MTRSPKTGAAVGPPAVAPPGDVSPPLTSRAKPPEVAARASGGTPAPVRVPRRAADPGTLTGSTPGSPVRAGTRDAGKPGRAPYEKARPGQNSAYVRGGATLTATASCQRCDWTAGPGDPAAVDKAAEKHTKDAPKHPTGTVLEPARRTA